MALVATGIHFRTPKSQYDGAPVGISLSRFFVVSETFPLSIFKNPETLPFLLDPSRPTFEFLLTYTALGRTPFRTGTLLDLQRYFVCDIFLAMDVVLELTDTFILDYLYAWALPARAAFGFPDYPSANATGQAFSTWKYEPATHFFSVEPSQAAYQSAWSRDNIYRQGLSLYLITWCVYHLDQPLLVYAVWEWPG